MWTHTKLWNTIKTVLVKYPKPDLRTYFCGHIWTEWSALPKFYSISLWQHSLRLSPPLKTYTPKTYTLKTYTLKTYLPWRPTTFWSTQFFCFYFFTSLIGGFKGGKEELGGIKGDIDGFEGFKGDKEGLRGISRILSIKMDRGIYRDEEDLLLNL